MNSPPRKPTLLSDATQASTRNHVLADLERGKSTLRPVGRRRSDRPMPWRGLMLCTLFICGAIGLYGYARDSSDHATAHTTALTSQPTHSPSAPSDSFTTGKVIPPAAVVAPEPVAQAATIISASPAELMADARIAAPHESDSAIKPSSAAMPVNTAVNKPAVQPASAQGNAPPAAVRKTAMPSASTTLARTTAAPAPVAATSTTKASEAAVAASSSSADSDVDLLAALIARARQRDPTPVKQKNSEPPCSGQSADSICSR